MNRPDPHTDQQQRAPEATGTGGWQALRRWAAPLVSQAMAGWHQLSRAVADFGKNRRQRNALLAALAVEILLILWLGTIYFPLPPAREEMEINFARDDDFDFSQLKPPPEDKIPDISKYLNNRHLTDLASNEWQDEASDRELRQTQDQSTTENAQEDENTDDTGEPGLPEQEKQLKPHLENAGPTPTKPEEIARQKSFKGVSRIRYYVRGRWKVSLRNPLYTCPDNMHGWITVRIEVDPRGRVIRAQFDPKRSTATYECLIDAALRYARHTRFNDDPHAPPVSTGYIRYLF